jgi:hypothetical protein
MPDAVINGRRVRRPSAAAGIMLYDDAGQERGGYATFSPGRTIALSLDTRKGQVAFIGADSAGGAGLGFYEGNDRLELRASKDQGTGLYVFQNGKLTIQQPPMNRDEEAKACVELKDELKQSGQTIPVPRLLTLCELHLSSEACHRCLDAK